ncbi:MAG: hypothetical protein ACTSRZ_03995 [Promethearchaeota archaeon]
MALGIFFVERMNDINMNILAKYFIPKVDQKKIENAIDLAVLNQLPFRHGLDNNKNDIKQTISYRTDSIKLFSIFLDKLDESKENYSYFLIFILEKKESLEPYSIMIDEVKELLKLKINLPEKQIQELLKNILEVRQELFKLIRERNLIEKKISNRANQLLDKGDFESAQELIKHAKTIPEKLSMLVRKGDDASSSKNYRLAAKYYGDAANLAKKIQENEMQQLLLKMEQRMQEIPNYKKNWEQIISNIIKPFKKLSKRERGIYLEPIAPLNQAIQISDILEDDQMIDDLKQLEFLLKKASKLSLELNQIDDKILEIIEKLKK